ncbi:MAG: hypothetical protein QOJ19_3673 [Acidimicrobiia bacterium]|nr:hypothetical protein [Acidimicrobiia bacterium]
MPVPGRRPAGIVLERWPGEHARKLWRRQRAAAISGTSSVSGVSGIAGRSAGLVGDNLDLASIGNELDLASIGDNLDLGTDVDSSVVTDDLDLVVHGGAVDRDLVVVIRLGLYGYRSPPAALYLARLTSFGAPWCRYTTAAGLGLHAAQPGPVAEAAMLGLVDIGAGAVGEIEMASGRKGSPGGWPGRRIRDDVTSGVAIFDDVRVPIGGRQDDLLCAFGLVREGMHLASVWPTCRRGRHDGRRNGRVIASEASRRCPQRDLLSRASREPIVQRLPQRLAYAIRRGSRFGAGSGN